MHTVPLSWIEEASHNAFSTEELRSSPSMLASVLSEQGTDSQGFSLWVVQWSCFKKYGKKWASFQMLLDPIVNTGSKFKWPMLTKKESNIERNKFCFPLVSQCRSLSSEPKGSHRTKENVWFFQPWLCEYKVA
jgi:hypothetical protein